MGTTANASANDLTETVVYYATPDLEGAARGVAAAIPEADVRLSEQFAEIGTPLVLVVGSDYAAAHRRLIVAPNRCHSATFPCAGPLVPRRHLVSIWNWSLYPV